MTSLRSVGAAIILVPASLAAFTLIPRSTPSPTSLVSHHWGGSPIATSDPKPHTHT